MGSSIWSVTESMVSSRSPKASTGRPAVPTPSESYATTIGFEPGSSGACSNRKRGPSVRSRSASTGARARAMAGCRDSAGAASHASSSAIARRNRRTSSSVRLVRSRSGSSQDPRRLLAHTCPVLDQPQCERGLGGEDLLLVLDGPQDRAVLVQLPPDVGIPVLDQPLTLRAPLKGWPTLPRAHMRR